MAFGNFAHGFVDRNFGCKFDADGDWDRAFVDRVHALDEAGFQSGRLTPTHMLAVVGNEPAVEPLHSRGISPAMAVPPT